MTRFAAVPLRRAAGAFGQEMQVRIWLELFEDFFVAALAYVRANILRGWTGGGCRKSSTFFRRLGLCGRELSARRQQGEQNNRNSGNNLPT